MSIDRRRMRATIRIQRNIHIRDEDDTEDDDAKEESNDDNDDDDDNARIYQPQRFENDIFGDEKYHELITNIQHYYKDDYIEANDDNDGNGHHGGLVASTYDDGSSLSPWYSDTLLALENWQQHTTEHFFNRWREAFLAHQSALGFQYLLPSHRSHLQKQYWKRWRLEFLQQRKQRMLLVTSISHWAKSLLHRYLAAWIEATNRRFEYVETMRKEELYNAVEVWRRNVLTSKVDRQNLEYFESFRQFNKLRYAWSIWKSSLHRVDHAIAHMWLGRVSSSLDVWKNYTRLHQHRRYLDSIGTQYNLHRRLLHWRRQSLNRRRVYFAREHSLLDLMSTAFRKWQSTYANSMHMQELETAGMEHYLASSRHRAFNHWVDFCRVQQSRRQTNEVSRKAWLKTLFNSWKSCLPLEPANSLRQKLAVADAFHRKQMLYTVLDRWISLYNITQNLEEQLLSTCEGFQKQSAIKKWCAIVQVQIHFSRIRQKLSLITFFKRWRLQAFWSLAKKRIEINMVPRTSEIQPHSSSLPRYTAIDYSKLQKYRLILLRWRHLPEIMVFSHWKDQILSRKVDDHLEKLSSTHYKNRRRQLAVQHWKLITDWCRTTQSSARAGDQKLLSASFSIWIAHLLKKRALRLADRVSKHKLIVMTFMQWQIAFEDIERQKMAIAFQSQHSLENTIIVWANHASHRIQVQKIHLQCVNFNENHLLLQAWQNWRFYYQNRYRLHLRIKSFKEKSKINKLKEIISKWVSYAKFKTFLLRIENQYTLRRMDMLFQFWNHSMNVSRTEKRLDSLSLEFIGNNQRKIQLDYLHHWSSWARSRRLINDTVTRFKQHHICKESFACWKLNFTVLKRLQEWDQNALALNTDRLQRSALDIWKALAIKTRLLRLSAIYLTTWRNHFTLGSVFPSVCAIPPTGLQIQNPNGRFLVSLGDWTAALGSRDLQTSISGMTTHSSAIKIRAILVVTSTANLLQNLSNCFAFHPTGEKDKTSFVPFKEFRDRTVEPDKGLERDPEGSFLIESDDNLVTFSARLVIGSCFLLWKRKSDRNYQQREFIEKCNARAIRRTFSGWRFVYTAHIKMHQRARRWKLARLITSALCRWKQFIAHQKVLMDQASAMYFILCKRHAYSYFRNWQQGFADQMHGKSLLKTADLFNRKLLIRFSCKNWKDVAECAKKYRGLTSIIQQHISGNVVSVAFAHWKLLYDHLCARQRFAARKRLAQLKEAVQCWKSFVVWKRFTHLVISRRHKSKVGFFMSWKNYTAQKRIDLENAEWIRRLHLSRLVLDALRIWRAVASIQQLNRMGDEFAYIHLLAEAWRSWQTKLATTKQYKRMFKTIQSGRSTAIQTKTFAFWRNYAQFRRSSRLTLKLRTFQLWKDAFQYKMDSFRLLMTYFNRWHTYKNHGISQWLLAASIHHRKAAQASFHSFRANHQRQKLLRKEGQLASSMNTKFVLGHAFTAWLSAWRHICNENKAAINFTQSKNCVRMKQILLHWHSAMKTKTKKRWFDNIQTEIVHLSMIKRYFHHWIRILKLQTVVQKRSRSLTRSLFYDWQKLTQASVLHRRNATRQYIRIWKHVLEIRKQQDTLNRVSHHRKLLGQHFSFWRAAFLARQYADGKVSPFRMSSLQDLTREFTQSPSKGIPQIHSPALSSISISSRPSSRSQSPHLTAIESHSSLSSRSSSPNLSTFSLENPRTARSSLNPSQNANVNAVRIARSQLGNKLL